MGYIGISKSKTNLNTVPIYAFTALGGYYNDQHHPEYCGKEWMNGDIITILLDTKNKLLELQVNNIKDGEIKNVTLNNMIYYLAISMGYENQQMQLLNFQALNANIH